LVKFRCRFRQEEMVDPSLMTKFRKTRITEDILEEMLKETIRQAIEKGIIKSNTIIVNWSLPIPPAYFYKPVVHCPISFGLLLIIRVSFHPRKKDSVHAFFKHLFPPKTLFPEQLQTSLRHIRIIKDTFILCYFFQSYIYAQGRSIRTVRGHSLNYIGYRHDARFH
jgi:hypothetical protein